MDLLIGTGQMAKQYALSLEKLNRPYMVLGNSDESSNVFGRKFGKEVLSGSFRLNKALLSSYKFENIFIAVTEKQIFYCLKNLSDLNNFEKVFIEKPGALSFEEVISIQKFLNSEKFYVSYNRRFYSSVEKLIQLSREEGGFIGCHFDFTEFSHRILSLDIPQERLQNWFFLNSTHVIDLAFFLIGKPKELVARNYGKRSWHGNGDHFMGMGVSDKMVPFTYHSHWGAPGRWGLELTTVKSKYFLKPIEDLQVQRLGGFTVESIALDKEEGVKEGIFKIVENASIGDFTFFIPYEELLEMIPWYQKIKLGT